MLQIVDYSGVRIKSLFVNIAGLEREKASMDITVSLEW